LLLRAAPQRPVNRACEAARDRTARR